MTLSQSLADKITSMDRENLLEIAQFIEFIDLRRHIEDAEDLRIAYERENEPSVPAQKVRELLNL